MLPTTVGDKRGKERKREEGDGGKMSGREGKKRVRQKEMEEIRKWKRNDGKQGNTGKDCGMNVKKIREREREREGA